MSEPELCYVCKKERKGKGSLVWIACDESSGCGHWFHVGCVGLTGATTAMVKALKGWRCPPCLLNPKPSSTSTSTSKKRDDRSPPNDAPGTLSDMVSAAVLLFFKSVEFTTMVRSILAELLPVETRKIVTEIEKTKPFAPPPRSFAEAASTVAGLSRQIRREEATHAARRDNLVIRGLSPGSDTAEDEVQVKELAEAIDVPLEGIQFTTKRVGTVKEDGTQMLVLTIEQQTRKSLLLAAKKLKDLPEYTNVYVSPDRTPSELHEDFLRRSELKKKKADYPDKQWAIRRGKVVEVKPE